MENVHWQYVDNELWGNNEFYWVVSNVMPPVKRLKNTSEQLVMSQRNFLCFGASTSAHLQQHH